jgi:hypothetical protein
MPNLFPIPALVEILIGSTWQDITSYVLQRDGITINGGSPDSSTSTPQPATCTFTVSNTDGRFSPNNTAGAYYPNLTRNVQVRVSVVGATSASGNTYSGYRFWGKISTWPTAQDISGADVFVSVTANGPLRQLNMGGGQGSALTRYYQTLTGLNAPVAYWPCEEDPDNTGTLGAGIDGGTPMSVTQGEPTWKAVSATHGGFQGSAPIPIINQSTWDGVTGQFASSGNDVYSNGGTYQWTASTTSVTASCWGAGGGGENGNGQGGGGGGEYASQVVTVTVGNSYTLKVGNGGQGGAGAYGTDNGGTAGGQSFFTGDAAVTVTGHGGGGAASTIGGAGGSGSTNTTHHSGGAGGVQAFFGPRGTGGGGGGGSGGTSLAGNQGSDSAGTTGGAGAVAVAGGGSGGHGGKGGSSGTGGSPGNPGGSPGGGGGGGGFNNTTGFGRVGGDGNDGQVALVYAAQTQATINVIRFLLWVPPHGGNNGKVLVRIITGGTAGALEVIYGSGGTLKLQGRATVNGTLLFDSGFGSFGAGASSIDGKPIMVSVEMLTSGANVNWALRAVNTRAQGAGWIPAIFTNSLTGTETTATVGNVSEVLVSPNGDITKSSVGHISVQYELIPLTKVVNALNAHDLEVGVDRFIRLATEQAVGTLVKYKEADDHWGFESGIQSWTGTNGTVTSSTVTNTGTVASTGEMIPDISWSWPSEGTHSLLLTATGGVGQWFASSPSGTSGRPILPADMVGAAADIYTPAALGAVQITINWYNAAGTYLSTSSGGGTTLATSAGTIATVKILATAPATAAFFNINIADVETKSAGTLLYIDHVRVHPHMGPQTTADVRSFLEEIKDLDQGLLTEAKTLWGLGYRTRISILNQTPSVILDFSAGTISQGSASAGGAGSAAGSGWGPVVDDVKIGNDITVKRKKGSKVQVTLVSGAMSILEPPAGTGRYKKNLHVAAAADEQLAALAAQLLSFGTVTNEQYPVITVDLTRASIRGNALAPLMSAVAGVEIGDCIQITNLPSYMPSTSTKQLVNGYTEFINARQWTISWNCVPEIPYEITTTALRRW